MATPSRFFDCVDFGEDEGGAIPNYSYPVTAGPGNGSFLSDVDNFGYQRPNDMKSGSDMNPYREYDGGVAEDCDGKAEYDSTTTGVNSSTTPNTQASTRTTSTSGSNADSQSSKSSHSQRHHHRHHYYHHNTNASTPSSVAVPLTSELDDVEPAAGPPSKKKGRKSKGKAAAASEEEQRRTKFLERNRLAASKCRQKKKEWVAGLEDQKTGLENQHSNLQIEYNGLLGEVTGLKEELMNHANCNDPNINQWLENEARKFVQETSVKLSGSSHRRPSHGSRRTSNLSSGHAGGTGGRSGEGYAIDPMLDEDGTIEDIMFSPASTQDQDFGDASTMYRHGR